MAGIGWAPLGGEWWTWQWCEPILPAQPRPTGGFWRRTHGRWLDTQGQASRSDSVHCIEATAGPLLSPVLRLKPRLPAALPAPFLSEVPLDSARPRHPAAPAFRLLVQYQSACPAARGGSC
jgi:hypothetical protein